MKHTEQKNGNLGAAPHASKRSQGEESVQRAPMGCGDSVVLELGLEGGHRGSILIEGDFGSRLGARRRIGLLGVELDGILASGLGRDLLNVVGAIAPGLDAPHTAEI